MEEHRQEAMECLKAPGEELDLLVGESIEEDDKDDEGEPAGITSPLIRTLRKPSTVGLKSLKTLVSHFPWQMTNAS